MTFTPADKLSLIIFSIFSFVMLGLILYSFYRANPKRQHYIFLASYLISFSIIVSTGLVHSNFIPFGPILFLSVFLVVIILIKSHLGRDMAERHSLTFLIGIQAFRLPLELILHHWASIGTIPQTMTWSGQNFDVITGILALLALPLVNRLRWLAWSVHLIGFALLINVLRIVVMSSPLPFSWHLEQPLQLIMYLPYALIGPLFVGVALAFHLLTFQKLRQPT